LILRGAKNKKGLVFLLLKFYPQSSTFLQKVFLSVPVNRQNKMVFRFEEKKQKKLVLDCLIEGVTVYFIKIHNPSRAMAFKIF